MRDSDATLILATEPLTGGSELTRRLAEQLGRPCLVLDPRRENARPPLVDWLVEHRVGVLNVAGPRESTAPGIHDHARRFLRGALQDLRQPE